MGNKAWGVIVEGIGMDTSSHAPSLYCSQYLSPIQYVTIDGKNYKCVPEVVLDYPQISASSFDPITGAVRSGSCTFGFTASDRMLRDFATQAQALKMATRVNLYVSATATQMQFVSNIASGKYYYLDQEVIYVDSLHSGTTYNVVRGCGDTLPTVHQPGASLYDKPQYWIGRQIKIVELNLPDRIAQPVTPDSINILWSGYINSSPQLTNSTSRIKIQASSNYDMIFNISLNRNPLQLNKNATTTVWYFNDVYLLNPLQADSFFKGVGNNTLRETTRVYKYYTWRDETHVRAVQVDQSLVFIYREQAGIGIGNIQKVFSKAMMGSPTLPESYDSELNQHVSLDSANYELLVWSKELDQQMDDFFGDAFLSPTYFCQYPYHPLTIALSMLVSTTGLTADPNTYDVLHPNWSIQVKDIIDLSEWEDLMSRTSWMEIDQLVLGWDGEEFKPWDFITTKLLPAYSLALVPTSDGKLKPIQVGLADVGSYAQAPVIPPQPQKWDWELASGNATHNYLATVGTLPWSAGKIVEVRGNSQIRDVSAYLNKDSTMKFDWPFLDKSSSQIYGLTQLLDLLTWRYEGLPTITFNLDAKSNPTIGLGVLVRLAKPDGLISFILIDKDGNRVDDWAAIPFVAQITSIRQDVKNGNLECKAMLVNYGVEKLAKWRAPGVRIKSRLGSGQYIIEGLFSDFERSESDALTLTVGDEVVLSTKTLGVKSTTVLVVTSITPSGSDYLVTFSSDWSPVGTSGDWIVLAKSSDYENTNVVGAIEPYPYVFMTNQTTLPRPSSGVTEPDIYA